MGFRTGAYARVWDTKPISDTSTKLRISISHKNKDTGEYIQDFSGFVFCVGSAAASKAARLREGDRIKLGDVDVTNKYDRDKKITYTNFKIFSFDSVESGGSPSQAAADPSPVVDDGVLDDSGLNSKLPF